MPAPTTATRVTLSARKKWTLNSKATTRNLVHSRIFRAGSCFLRAVRRCTTGFRLLGQLQACFCSRPPLQYHTPGTLRALLHVPLEKALPTGHDPRREGGCLK
eukprot:1947062-Rhodomonas_salina.1